MLSVATLLPALDPIYGIPSYKNRVYNISMRVLSLDPIYMVFHPTNIEYINEGLHWV